MKNKFILGIVTAFALSGCMNSLTNEYVYQEPKEPVKLPYNFFLESFVDQRPTKADPTLIDVLSTRKQLPFNEDVFVKAMVKKVNGKSIYDYEDATLRIELKDYAAFIQDWHYTLSFYVDVTGFDEKGKVLTTGVFSCLVERNEAKAFVSSLGYLLSHDQNTPKAEVKQMKVWDGLYNDCIADIAYQFNNKVVEWGRGKRS
ncbi:MAG: hypothetical protein ACI9TY_001809 [Alphaproteobacteria bacterium]|jgi:hypothetical protein